MTLSLVPTEDGSLSCFDEETRELYHNRAGAYTEALKNYCEVSGAAETLKATGQLRVLDVCFGLGYNTWVLLTEILKTSLPGFTIEVRAVERDAEILKCLPQVLEDPRLCPLKSIFGPLEHNIYYRTLRGPLRLEAEIPGSEGVSGRISVEVHTEDLRQTIPALADPVDLIFHDAFSPNKVPELWTVDLFRHYARLLSPSNGRLLTYSAAGAVRGGLAEAGFHVLRTQAVGRKSGGTLATQAEPPTVIRQNPAAVFPLTEEEAARLQGRSGIPYRDPDFQTPREAVLKNREREQQSFGI